MKQPMMAMSPSIAPAANEGVGGVIGLHCALPHPSWPTADRSDPVVVVVVVHGKLAEKPACCPWPSPAGEQLPKQPTVAVPIYAAPAI